jgi:hypothetical protein
MALPAPSAHATMALSAGPVTTRFCMAKINSARLYLFASAVRPQGVDGRV